MDPLKFLSNLLELLTDNSTLSLILFGLGFIGYIVYAVFLGRIFKKASQPTVAAFVPFWNAAIFYRLGGYSPLWIIGSVITSIYIGFGGYAIVARMAGQEWAGSDFAKAVVDSLAYGAPITGLLLFATLVVGLLAAYNIGRAFERDAGYLLLFIFAYPIWLIALAFTSYDWDEDSANPNSIGETDRTKMRRAAALEESRSKARSAAFLDPVAPQLRNFDVIESDYDRAVREQAALGGIPQQKPEKKRGKTDPNEGRIVDVGSNDPNINPDWL